MAEIGPGTEIAGYRVESIIGRGGMAVVYRAEDSRLGRKVALKLLAPVLAENEQFQQRFIRESRLAASLDHPNIVPIYEAGESGGHLFIAMRYVPGSDLKALLAQEGRLPPARLLRLFVQIGDALDAAHGLGLVHRDVKPGNILITATAEHSGHAHPDHVYLTDFGLTKRTTSLSGSLTGTGHFLGTVDYVSPEQIQGATVGPSTDIYALGCVLYECLTGQLPFRRDDDAAMLWAHLAEMPPPVSLARPDLSPTVDDVVFRAMAKAPEERYEACRDLIRDLEDALNVREQLPSNARLGSRQDALRSHVADGTARREGLPPSQSTAAGRPSGTPAPGGLPEADPESTVAPGWVSHPSLPPGAIGPLPWQKSTESVEEGDQRDEPRAMADDLLDQDRDLEEDGAFDEQVAEDSAWEEDEQASGLSAHPERPRRRWVVILATAVVLGLALVGGVLLLQSRDDPALRQYAKPDAAVPFSLRYPETWSVQTGAASDVVFSPRSDAVADTFLLQTSEGAWTGTRALLKSAPADAVGAYVFTTFSAGVEPTTEGFRKAIEDQMRNSTITFTAIHRQLPLDGAIAHEFEGTLRDRTDPAARLQAMFDLVLPPEGGLVLLAYFAPPAEFEERRALFTRMRDSVRFGQ